MEDDASFSLEGKSLTNLRVVDLKQELEKRGLSKSGSKKDLVKRLKQQLEFEKLCEDRKTTGDCDLKLELDAVTEQNEFVQQYLAQQQKIYAEQKEVKRLIELEEIQKSGDEIESCDSKLEDDTLIQNPEENIINTSEFEELSKNECNEKSDLALGEIVERSSTESASPKHSDDQVHITVLHQDSSFDKRCRSSFEKSPVSDMEKPAQFSTVSNVPYSLADIQLPDSPGKRLKKSVVKAKISDDGRVDTHSVQNSGCFDAMKQKQSVSSDIHESSSNGVSSTQDLITINAGYVASGETNTESEIVTDSKDPEDVVETCIVTLSEEIVSEKNEETISMKSSENESNDAITTNKSVHEQEIVPTNETTGDDISQSDCVKTLNEAEQKVKSTDELAQVEPDRKEKKLQDSDTEKSSESDEEQSSSRRSGKHLPSRESCKKNSPSSRSLSSDSSSRSSESSSERESYVKHHEDPKSRSHRSSENKKSEAVISDVPGEKDAVKKTTPSPKNELPKQRLKIKRNNIVKIENAVASTSEIFADSQASPEKESLSLAKSPDEPAEVERETKDKTPQDNDTEKSSESDEQPSSRRSGKHLPSRKSCKKASPSSRSLSSDSSSRSSESIPERKSHVKHLEDSKSRSHRSSENKKSEAVISDVPDEKDAVKKTALSPKNELPKQRLKIKRNNIVKIENAVDSTSEIFADNQASSEKESLSSTVEADISPEVQLQDSSEKSSKSAEPLHVRITHRKISISSRKLNRKSVEEDKVDEPGLKKSRWGSYTSSLPKTSISISTDSLKNLIPDFKLISGPISSNDIEDVLAPVSPNGLAPVKETKQTNLPAAKDLADEELMDTLSNSQVSTSKKEFEPEQLPLKCSSPQGPISKIIFIQNLVRPFTLLQLKELLKQTGTIVEEHFWIDKIKSKCFVMYGTEEESIRTRNALNGTRWPSSNPKILSVEFATQEGLDFHKNVSEGPKTLPPALVPVNTEIFETRTVLPIEEHKKKEKDRRKEKERTKPLPPVREWDKDKLTQESPDREHVNREPERIKNLEKKEKKDTKRRPNEDTPAKLLDDLFQKTKSSPCIYWLPLTEEQVKQREEDRRLRRLEREKRSQQQREQEEVERRNRRARPGQKSRDKENRRSQSRSRSPVARRR